MALQRPPKRARTAINGVTRERLDPYSYDIVHSRESSRGSRQTAESARSPQKGRSPWEASSMWSSTLNLVDDPEMGLVDGDNDVWEDFENESPGEESTDIPKIPKKPRKPQVGSFLCDLLLDLRCSVSSSILTLNGFAFIAKPILTRPFVTRAERIS